MIGLQYALQIQLRKYNSSNEPLTASLMSAVNVLAGVTPLFKQGDRDNVNNYHLISVIPVVVKVFERIVYEQLYDCLEEHDILCKHVSFSCSSFQLLQLYLRQLTPVHIMLIPGTSAVSIPLTTRFFYLGSTFMVYLRIHLNGFSRI